MSRKRIAVIAGDGIGKEVMPEGLRVMEAAASRFGIDLQFDDRVEADFAALADAVEAIGARQCTLVGQPRRQRATGRQGGGAARRRPHVDDGESVGLQCLAARSSGRMLRAV